MSTHKLSTVTNNKKIIKHYTLTDVVNKDNSSLSFIF